VGGLSIDCTPSGLPGGANSEETENQEVPKFVSEVIKSIESKDSEDERIPDLKQVLIERRFGNLAVGLNCANNGMNQPD
jgi:hypothetical protein